VTTPSVYQIAHRRLKASGRAAMQTFDNEDGPVATSNRDRIGKMFELLAPALDDFIARSVAPKLPEGASWTALVAMKDTKKGIEGKEYERLDPQVQLRMLTENIPHGLKAGWYPFDDAIGRVGQGYRKELREARNEWAHNKSFSDDDAYRCLDTPGRGGRRRCGQTGWHDARPRQRGTRASRRAGSRTRRGLGVRAPAPRCRDVGPAPAAGSSRRRR